MVPSTSSINYLIQGKHTTALATIIATDTALVPIIIFKVIHSRMTDSLKVGKIGKTGFLNGRSRVDGIW